MQNLIRKTLLSLLIVMANIGNAQESPSVKQDSVKVSVKENPIIFYEGYLGGGGGRSAGWVLGGTINYQFFRTDLLTARIGAFIGFDVQAALIAPTVAIPIFQRDEKIVDYGLLYGKRWIRKGVSFSVSAGVSYINHQYLEKIDDVYYVREQNLTGIPFELNVKFFKNQKRRFRLYYGLIPVTKKKVSFGRSVGLKLVGNISKATYTGFAISYGFGCHKKY